MVNTQDGAINGENSSEAYEGLADDKAQPAAPQLNKTNF